MTEAIQEAATARNVVRVDPDRLLGFAAAAYEACGLGAADARLCADTLVRADLWGHGSHGVMRLPWYAARLRSGACNPKAAPEPVVDAGALAVVDGQAGMRQVLTAYAADEAVRRAKAHGIGAVGIRNSGHFGTAMYFTLRAAAEGCVAFLSANASPTMAPWGGREKRVGTNPWSWAAPVGFRPPMVLDIANTGVARGKIYLARQKGQSIPQGWALDAKGAPTTDPAAAIGGLILPMAGHKGYGIGVMMDVLPGVLTGSAFGASVVGPYEPEKRSGAGQMMIALNIEAIMPRAAFEARMEALVAELKSTPLAEGVEEIFYPGEIEARSEERGARTRRRPAVAARHRRRPDEARGRVGARLPRALGGRGGIMITSISPATNEELPRGACRGAAGAGAALAMPVPVLPPGGERGIEG